MRQCQSCLWMIGITMADEPGPAFRGRRFSAEETVLFGVE
jgi:hypothetical protein